MVCSTPQKQTSTVVVLNVHLVQIKMPVHEIKTARAYAVFKPSARLLVVMTVFKTEMKQESTAVAPVLLVVQPKPVALQVTVRAGFVLKVDAKRQTVGTV